ncbi:MAG: M48 family metallopeptidase [Bacteroidales bacterium]
MRVNPRTLLLLLASSFLLDACQIVPITGRKQINLLPEATIVEMGFANFEAFMKENPVSTNKAASDLVALTGSKISGAVNRFLKDNGLEQELANYRWEFKLVADKTPNAWCLPGGKVVVYEGLLPYTQDESGLAVVIGHEVAHAVARHGNERLSQGMMTDLGGMALSLAMETRPQQTRDIFLAAYGVGAQVGILLPYSRLHEKEADRLGLIFIAMAGYDPNGAVTFWERMSKAKAGQTVPEWLSTHPLDETRIAEMKKNLPEAIKYYQNARIY